MYKTKVHTASLHGDNGERAVGVWPCQPADGGDAALLSIFDPRAISDIPTDARLMYTNSSFAPPPLLCLLPFFSSFFFAQPRLLGEAGWVLSELGLARTPASWTTRLVPLFSCVSTPRSSNRHVCAPEAHVYTRAKELESALDGGSNGRWSA